MNNNILLIGMIIFFIMLGLTIPYLQSFGGIDRTEINVNDELEGIIYQNPDGLDLFVSVSTILFWSFNLHWLINLLLLTPLRLLFWVIVYDKIRGIS